MTNPTISRWQGVTKQIPYPVCAKTDWCMISADGTAAICAHIQSDRPAGHKNSGWLLKLKYNPQPTLFECSPIILDKVDEYRRAN